MYVSIVGSFTSFLFLKTLEKTGLIYLLLRILPLGLTWFWLLFNGAGIALFLILLKKYYCKEPFFIKYPSAEEIAEMKARTKEANIKFDKAMFADDSENSSRPSAATSRRTRSARGQ